MIQNNRTQSEKIEFKFHAPDAKSVGLAGSFNGWDATQTPLRRRLGGDWSATLKLTPGRHEYRFVADGKWFTDPGADETASNPYGERNSVRVV